MSILEEISGHLQEGDDRQVARLTRQAIDEKLAAGDILDRGLVAGMHVIGKKFRDHEIFLPDVLLAAKAMTAGMQLLEPLLVSQDVPRRGKVVLGSVKGDLHDIGKNLVGIMLRGAGFEVIDLGHDVAPEAFVETATREGAQVIGMSTLLTTTMPVMKTVIELLRGGESPGTTDPGPAGADRPRVIVGGAPVSEEFAREIGADAYGYDAASAVQRVQALVGEG